MSSPRRSLRWWPLFVILALFGATVTAAFLKKDWGHEQERSLLLLGAGVVTVALCLIWWLLLSRAPWRLRLAGLALAALPVILFRYRGVTGDFVPIIEFRFAPKPRIIAGDADLARKARPDFPQFLGPDRNGKLAGPVLATDWKSKPPEILWRQPIGAAWGGFSVADGRAYTQEQHGEEEWVTCYDVTTGKQQWRAANPGRYATKIAGAGPRATPTVSGGRVLTFGATGVLRCLDASTGRDLWTKNVAAEFGASLPDWGFASSPLIVDETVLVSVGAPNGKSLIAFKLADGALAWAAGNHGADYSSPFLVRCAGREQVALFTHRHISAHDPSTGALLWEQAWGKGMPTISRPIAVGENRLFFSSGYGVGSALFEITPTGEGGYKVDELWKTPRFQAKFSNPVQKDHCVYGVSDGIFACLDLTDGVVKWKDGRYGHGQGLMIGDLYLQMSESGELVLLQPSPAGAHELGRFEVFSTKTWNPIALTGDLLLVRNDEEAACVRLPLAR